MRGKTFRLKKTAKLALFATAVFALYAVKEVFFQSSILYSKTYWWIDLSKIPKRFLSKCNHFMLINEINRMLNDKRGWGSCGIDFQYTENKHQADVLIYPVNKLKDGTLGITEWGLGHKNQCTIKLLGPWACESMNAFLKILNHEFGHALLEFAGFFPHHTFHSRDEKDLMYWRLNEDAELFPNTKYIKKIKHRVISHEDKTFSVLSKC